MNGNSRPFDKCPALQKTDLLKNACIALCRLHARDQKTRNPQQNMPVNFVDRAKLRSGHDTDREDNADHIPDFQRGSL